MFDKNFSFLSSPSSPAFWTSNDTAQSTPDLSPFSSRCPSPLLLPTEPPTITATSSSLALRHRDNRFDSRPNLTLLNVPRHPSITALTFDFDSQALKSPSDLSVSSSAYSDVSTPHTELDDLDDGFDETDHHTTSSSNSTFDPSLWDLSMAVLNKTSCPSHSTPSFAIRRRQRQALTRLQCLTNKAPDLVMLVEECHPSSLPMMDKGRVKSISSASGKIGKERSMGGSAMTKMSRKRNTR